jgi:hypothetical protein
VLEVPTKIIVNLLDIEHTDDMLRSSNGFHRDVDTTDNPLKKVVVPEISQ